MICRISPLLAAWVLAAMAMPCIPTILAAQTGDPAPADSPDPPDIVYQTGAVPEDPAIELGRPIVKHHRAFLPLTVDLSSRMPEVGDQGHSQSCTAWATAYAARGYYASALENRNVRQRANLPSPSYVYHLSRQNGCDEGTTIGRAAEVLKNGALSLAEYPFTDVCSPPPSADVVARAHDFKVQGIRRVDISQPDDIKGQLAQANPVMISFKVSTAWMRLRGSTVFTEANPPADDKVQGGHAMTIVGYDEHRQAFRLINSWGKGWGDHGYGWVSYDLLKSGRIRGAYVLDMGGAKPQTIVPPGPDPGPQPGPVPIPQLSELQNLQCGRVTAEQQNGQSVLTGFVATEDDLKKVRTVAASAGVTVGNVILAPWPQCEALQTLEKPLQVADRPAIDVGGKTELVDGEPLRIQLRSPGQISYLYVSYIQADGSVVHLVQPSGVVAQPTLPRQSLMFGSGDQGKAKFTVGPPFGREMIIAIASRSPLFDRALPQQQTERDYLTTLRRALGYKPSTDMPDRELAASITTLQTRER
jgi:hypothetical protein